VGGAGGADEDIVFGGPGNDMIDGVTGDDDIFAGAGADYVKGFTGDDRIQGGAGVDLLDGNQDNDVIISADNEPDAAACGGGKNRVIRDGVDLPLRCQKDRILKPAESRAFLKTHDQDEPKASGG
jgi:Ca2+-binding RTX toxin-like protein